MKVIIASDSHRRNDRLRVLEEMYPAALLVHSGDFQEDPRKFDHWISVPGNNDTDFSQGLEEKRIVLIEGHRVLLLHGHQVSSRGRLEKLAHMAAEEGCDTVIFGHSHVPQIEKTDGVLILNPGSLYRSRKAYGPTYIEADFLPGKIEAKICAFPAD